LNCLLPHHTPHATEHIADIIALIEKLIARASPIKPPTVRFISASRNTRLRLRLRPVAQVNFDEMRAGERVKSDEYAKESVADFALWKLACRRTARFFGRANHWAKAVRAGTSNVPP